MRIGVASWEYPPNHTGGLGRHVEGLTKSLSKLGHEVFVFIPERNCPDGVEGINFVKIHSKKKGFTWIRDVNELIVQKALELKLDVFHAQDWITFPSMIELKPFLPVVCSIHSTEHDRAGRILKQKNYSLELEENGLRVCDGVITVSDFMKKQLVGLFNVAEGKVNVIPNGVVSSDFSSDGSGGNILFLGRLTEQKGVEYLLYALKDYEFSGKIVILGDGHLQKSLKCFVDNLGLRDKIVFVGFVNDDELIKLHLSNASVLVMPSLREPFGIVALEGASAKVPLILSKSAGVSEFFTHDENALLIDPTNPSEIISSFDKLKDEELRSKLVDSAFDLVNSDVFDWNKIAEKTVRVYENFTSSK
ncbi:MAG: glycosyltransferase family 4 protein [Nanoarchaeota archaeon]|nr:glycosyltransferase family 4 protein [Nanoarchaeota archaeon]